MRSLTALFLLTTLAVASSCSSKEEPPVAGGWKTVPAVSGARLRARFIAAGDARELVGFYDSQRQEDCTFQRAEDQRMRCLPATAPYLATGAGFSDPACQTALGSPQQGCGDAKYAIASQFDGSCGQKPTGLRRLLDPGAPRYAAGPSGCTLQAASSSSLPLMAVGDVVPWTDFVEAVETATSGEPFAEKTLVASDGARQHLGFRIDNLDAECTFQITSDGQTRCVPSGPIGPVMYSDSACSKASFVNDYQSSGPCSAGTKFWLEQGPVTDTCGRIRAVYALSDSAIDASEAYVEANTDPPTCTSMESSGSYGVRRAIGVNLTASLPTTERVGRGSGRLVPAFVAQAGTQALALGWHDNDRNVDCSFTRASDGKLRCLPTGAPATIFFTDDACKSPSRVAVLLQSPCGTASLFARVASKTCPSKTRVFALGSETRNLSSGSNETDPGRCVSVAGITNAFDATEVDPAGFVEGVPVAE